MLSYIRLRKVWTPLKVVGTQLYRDPDTGKWYIKKRGYPLRRLRIRK